MGKRKQWSNVSDRRNVRTKKEENKDSSDLIFSTPDEAKLYMQCAVYPNAEELFAQYHHPIQHPNRNYASLKSQLGKYCLQDPSKFLKFCNQSQGPPGFRVEVHEHYSRDMAFFAKEMLSAMEKPPFKGTNVLEIMGYGNYEIPEMSDTKIKVTTKLQHCPIAKNDNCPIC